MRILQKNGQRMWIRRVREDSRQSNDVGGCQPWMFFVYISCRGPSKCID